MKRSLTTQCLSVFLLLDFVISPLLITAIPPVLGIAQLRSAYTVIAIFSLGRIVFWAILLGRLLEPYERYLRLAPTARTPQALVEADRAVSRLPLRFGVSYALSFGACLALSVLWLWSFGDGVPLGPGVREVTLLLVSALVLGTFALAFPLTTNLTTAAASASSTAARRERLSLERTQMSLQLRIGVVATCIGVAPTLWMTAVGYEKQSEAGRTEARLAAEPAARDLAHAIDELGVQALIDADPVALLIGVGATGPL